MGRLLPVAMFIMVIRCMPIDNTERIKNRFDQWKNDEISKGRVLSEENCNPSIALSKGLNQISGIPDEVDFSYAHINTDNLIDALVTFQPMQCDGGNGLMWAQIQIVILSNNGSYEIDDDYFKSIGNDLKGFYHLDSVTSSEFSGTYFEFLDGDAHCCPSVKKRITIQFKTNELRLTE